MEYLDFVPNLNVSPHWRRNDNNKLELNVYFLDHLLNEEREKRKEKRRKRKEKEEKKKKFYLSKKNFFFPQTKMTWGLMSQNICKS